MLFIGGTRDRQRILVREHCDKIYYAVEQPLRDIDSIPKDFKLKELHIKKELYIKKDIYFRKQYLFSVMVKDGSRDLLNAFLNTYNKRSEKL